MPPRLRAALLLPLLLAVLSVCSDPVRGAGADAGAGAGDVLTSSTGGGLPIELPWRTAASAERTLARGQPARSVG